MRLSTEIKRHFSIIHRSSISMQKLRVSAQKIAVSLMGHTSIQSEDKYSSNFYRRSCSTKVSTLENLDYEVFVWS